MIRRVLTPDQHLGAIGRQWHGSPIAQHQRKRRNGDRTGHRQKFGFEARKFTAGAFEQRIDRRLVLLEFADLVLFAPNLLDLRQRALRIRQRLLRNLKFRLFARQVGARFRQTFLGDCAQR